MAAPKNSVAKISTDRTSIAWTSLATSIIAVGSLLTAISAEKAQVIQNEPYIALSEAITKPSNHNHAEGTPPLLDTEVLFKNSGTTQATHLGFTSIGWYTASTIEQVRSQYTIGSRMKEIQETSPWQTLSATDSLDRDQPTRHLFQSFPHNDEPQQATDYLYVIATYDDEFMFPFRNHLTEKFCLIKLPPNADNGSKNPGWNRSPVGECASGYKQLTSKKQGPYNPEQ